MGTITKEGQKVLDWREETFRKLGFDHRDSKILASRHDIDLQKARWMIENGCPVELAWLILI